MSDAPPCPGCLALLQQVARLEERIRQLEARLALDSSNSHKPPSSDPPSAPPPTPPSGRERGGQPGHQGHSRVRLCRILSVTQTLKVRGLAVLDYLADALRAFRHGDPVAPVPESA